LRASFAGFNVAPLVVNEIYRSMTSSEFFLDLLMMRAFEILTEQLPTRAVIYRVEFQPFEKAILYGIRGKSLAIAFQHSTFGRNYLPYFFVPGEIALYRSNGSESTHMPLPDLVFTTGAYALDVLERNGFPRASLDVCGPVRFARLSKYIRDRQTKAALREKLGLSMSKKVFLVMTSVVREESMSLLAALSFALGELDEAPYIVFKSHPAMPMDGEFKRLVVPTLSDGDYRVLPVDAPIYDYMSLSEGVILAGSTVCLEAMVLGAIPIVFESKVVFDAKSMAEIGQAVLQVSNHRELKKAIGWVSAGDKRVNEMRRFASQAVEAMFYRLDKNPNRQFVSLLEGHGIIAEDTSREAAHA
jgi:surface carbohydrate biosynthesis protein (TIGR04326 family)